MKYITNIDTLSALLDRLISENIKLYFFKKDSLMYNVKHQEEVISDIRKRLVLLFTETFESKSYEYVSELRTYKPDDIVETLEELINNDITTGNCSVIVCQNLNQYLLNTGAVGVTWQ